MKTIPGFRRVVLFDRAATKNPVLPIFFAEERNLKVNDVDEVKDYNGRVISNMVEVGFTATVLSNGVDQYPPLIHLLAFYKDQGVSAEFLGEYKNGAHDGVVKFIGSNCLGINWECGWDQMKRFYTIDLKRRFPKSVFAAIASNAVTDTHTTFGTSPLLYEPGSNPMNNRSFAEFLSISWGSITELFAKTEIIDLSFKLSTDGAENYQKMGLTRRIMITLDVTIDKASISDLKALYDGSDELANGISPAVNYKVAYNEAGKTEEHKFAAGVLTRQKEVDWNQSTRFVKFKFTGSVNPHLITSAVVDSNFTFNYTT